ncbi:nicotinamide riboside kinase 1 [Teleopsis dalmanni]|uniref:nicotinamide riboside kinase 1-like n=1 Tax=Teleopsis dalmanni TaxID=139649 RepID=UPI000D32CB50|nr:nicotinamide riboside kinase 1-like [Teleopsis dalmanni]XP_037938806.1 nicotinamide riboside kinase 1 [Teleopsis dalmanni]
MPQWLVIGVSGVTCGGKTTLAHSLRDYFQSQRNIQLWNTPYVICDVQLLSQDDYFLPVDDLRHKWIEKLNCINFEVITSLDMKQMLSDITWTMKGRYLATDPINNIDYIKDVGISNNFEHYAPQTHHYQTHHYNQILNHHPTHIMRVSTHLSQARDNKINILILEGFMIFNQPELLTLCNLKFHFHLPYEKCYERRRKRTYDPPDVTGYFEMCVWPYYEKNFAAFRDRKDIICLNGEISKERIFKYVLERIMSYFEERCDVACPPPHKLLGIPGCSNGQITKVCPMEQQ